MQQQIINQQVINPRDENKNKHYGQVYMRRNHIDAKVGQGTNPDPPLA